MHRTLKVKFQVNAKQTMILETMAFAHTKLHNSTNYERVQQWKQTGKTSSQIAKTGKVVCLSITNRYSFGVTSGLEEKK